MPAHFRTPLTVTGKPPLADGKNWILVTALEYEREDGTILRAPAGMHTDGPSIPPRLESIIHQHGSHYLPCIMHDAAYEDQLESFIGGVWTRTTLDKAACDKLLWEAMGAVGTPFLERRIIFEAVNLAGREAFDEDRKAATS